MTRIFPALAALMISAAPAMAERVSVLVFDASGSMWNRVEGDLTRIEVARDVMGDYFASRDGAVPLSVIAYGHNRRGDCRDIEVIAPMGQTAPGALESRLRALMPRGMTPLTDSLARARDQIPPTAEAADIILVTDGLETCEGDPCALAASLAAEGIDIRAHVVGFGLSAVEVAALSCITDQTGGMLFQTNSGAELAEALQQVSMAPEAEPEPEPEPEQPARAAAFDIGDKAEAGFDYRIRWNGEARFVDYMGFVPQGESRAPTSSSYRTIGGTAAAPNNPATRTAPKTPGMYDLILSTARDGIIARQPVEVVAPAMGFDPIGSVEPGSRVLFTFRAPEQLGERIVIADLDQPVNEHQRYDWANALHTTGTTRLTVPSVPGDYELRYLNAGATAIMFSRRFGVGIPFADTDRTTSAELANQAAAATRGDASQDELAQVTATFRLPADLPQSDVTWSGVPLDPDMTSGPWASGQTGPVITGSFEPGTWRITATAPGEVTLSADVTIFPGQANDFIVQIDAGSDEDHGALDLQGPWRILTVPPYDAPPGSPIDPMKIMDIILETRADANGYQGRFTPAPAAFGTVLLEREIDSVLEEDGALIVTMALPMIDPAPFVLSVMPYAEGYAGTLVAGANSLAVVFWPDAVPLPPATQLRATLYGPDPADQGWLNDGSDAVFACAQSICAWTDPASGLTIPLPMGWSVTAPEFQTASAAPTDMALPSLSLFGPEGQELRLNPRQWIDSNGTCLETPDLGRLCHFADADITAQMVAGMIASMVHLGQPTAGAHTRPVSVSIAGADRSEMRKVRIQLVAGEDAAYQDGQLHDSEMAAKDHPLGVGNVYDIRAETLFREYRNRNVTITPGTTVQQVMLAPVYAFDEVTLELPDDPVIAGPGAFFPVTLVAPSDFQGSIALHDDDDRDAPALFSISSAELMNSTDPVLPVPEKPGYYEIRFLDINGEMFGGTVFEAVAPDAAQGAGAPEGSVSVALLSDWDLVAGSGGYFSVGIEAPAGLDGQLVIEGQDGTAVFTTGLAALIDAQDQALPIPDAPGIYMITITDKAGILRATTGFEVVADKARDHITVTLRATTQFGAGCMIGADLSMPPGPRITVTIPVTGVDAQGAAVTPIMRTERAQVLEIIGFDTAGATIVDASFLSPCEALILNMGPAQCRVGESSTMGSCPYPVSYIAPTTLLAVQQAGSDPVLPASGQPALPDRARPAATSGAAPHFIEIDLGDMDADTFLDILLPQTGSE
ncbi:MAG: VWA domain-containing protein [Rhodobacteraceae bacterium]|nr:VWA domain-containing protein [Paracoccaceae bacterium]